MPCNNSYYLCRVQTEENVEVSQWDILGGVVFRVAIIYKKTPRLVSGWTKPIACPGDLSYDSLELEMMYYVTCLIMTVNLVKPGIMLEKVTFVVLNLFQLCNLILLNNV